ncbi:MAG: hypothetical protein J7604_12390 [Sporocytophaga sp.]|uniref:hypothetical protein n=1 Tax=Sporocytophaga sp. TaxID=2231183 RepID=UPI001B01AFC6|nr:hypothetical protein [Sporocytophaga sp.]MBO9701003.1 hypothetical protein [Sporocytophaga sp.]
MADKFNWGYIKHDFSSIHETLGKYFPIENPDQFNGKDIRDFVGVKRVEEILNENFFTINYRERWGKFRKFLKEELKEPFHNSTIAFYPCYSGIVILKEEKNNNLTYTKELHFFISLLGPFYTILGIDKAEITLEEHFNWDKENSSSSYEANLVVTVSPYMEYQEPFNMLQKKIIEYFPSLKFIPYEVNIEKVEGVSLIYPDTQGDAKNSVFSALFRPDNYFNTETRGNTHYGFDEWLIVKKLDEERIREIKEGLLKRSLKIESELTVHKVWKLKKANYILQNITIIIDLFQIIDFSENNFATIIYKEDEEPLISNYSITDDRIEIESFQGRIRFRIQELGVNELKLILHVDFIPKDGEPYKYNVFEMIFEVYK